MVRSQDAINESAQLLHRGTTPRLQTHPLDLNPRPHDSSDLSARSSPSRRPPRRKTLPGDHVAYPHGITIAKPAADPRPDNRLTARWAPSRQRIEPSTLTLHHDGQTWTITRADQIPGPGPHDFTQSTASIEQAIELILDHFHASSRNASQR